MSVADQYPHPPVSPLATFYEFTNGEPLWQPFLQTTVFRKFWCWVSDTFGSIALSLANLWDIVATMNVDVATLRAEVAMLRADAAAMNGRITFLGGTLTCFELE